MASAAPEIFRRRIRRIRRDRAAMREASVVRAHIADELLARLEMVTRRFGRVLLLGAAGDLAALLRAGGAGVVTVDPGFRCARAAGGPQGDEDRLPIADAAFDLVLWPGGLECVNDVPGALALILRVLVPDGLFLAGFVGAGSLPRLRATMLAADAAVHGGAAARLHPQIDVRGAGDLLQRAGFALPVVDGERLELRYRDLNRLIDDLRDAGATNLLGGAPFLGKLGLAVAQAGFLDAADADGRTTEVLELVFLSGWSPSPDQPRAARRGSATASLADALKHS